LGCQDLEPVSLCPKCADYGFFSLDDTSNFETRGSVYEYDCKGILIVVRAEESVYFEYENKHGYCTASAAL
jgi:hypothetical protein